MDYRTHSHFSPPVHAAAPALVPASFNDSDDEVASPQVPFDIHQYFGLNPGTPICLDSLQNPPEGQKPQYTYATLVKLAIWSSPQRKLTLSGIFEALENRFPWFRIPEHQSAWKTSIRHSLSLLSVFVRLPFDIHLPGKGSFWTVDFSKGEGYKRPRKRGRKAETTDEGAEKEAAPAPTSGTKSGRRRLLQERSPMALAWEAHSTEFRWRDRVRVNRAHAPSTPYPTAEPSLALRHAAAVRPLPPQSADPTSPEGYFSPEPPSYSNPPRPPSSGGSASHYRTKTHTYPRTAIDERPRDGTVTGPYAATHWEGARSTHVAHRGTSAEVCNPPPLFSIYDGPFAPSPQHLASLPVPRPASESDAEEEDDDDEGEGERVYFPPTRAAYHAYRVAWRATETSTSESVSASSEQPITPIESYERSSNRERAPAHMRTYMPGPHAARDVSISPSASDEYASLPSSSAHFPRSSSRSESPPRGVSPFSGEPKKIDPKIMRSVGGDTVNHL